MPPAAKKDVSVILYDLNCKNQNACKQALLKLSCKEFFTESKNLTKLVLFNSSVSGNRLEAHHGGYDNIYETSQSIMKYDPQIFLDMVENIEPTEANNWWEAVLVATKCLVEDYSEIGGIVTHQLIVLSDFASSPPETDEDTIQEIIDGLKSVGAFAYFIGPEIEVPFTIKNPDSVRLWMQKLNIDENNGNLQLIKRIISNTENSVVCDFKMGVHLVYSYKNSAGSQPWKVPLSIGTAIEIPADTMKILNEGLEIKLKGECGESKMLWISAEDESIEVDPSRIIQGISRHGKFIEIPDNKMFQASNPRGFNIVCFTDSVNVPEYIMVDDGCYCVYPADNPISIEIMSILVDCLSKQNKYIIARRVYNNNSVPRIVALIPKPDHKPKCFYLASLPFADDIRLDYRERNVKLAPTLDKSSQVYNYLGRLDKTNKLPLHVSMMQDVNCTKLLDKAADKYLEKYLHLDEIDFDYLMPQKVEDELKSIWPERELKENIKEELKGENESDGEDFEW